MSPQLTLLIYFLLKLYRMVTFSAMLCQCTSHIWLYFDRCEDLGLEEITPGTNSIDVECGTKITVALIAGIIVTVMTVLLTVTGAIIFIKKKGTRNTHLQVGFILI